MGDVKVTAKVKLYYKTDQHNGSYALSFSPDYADGRNEQWAHATPSLSLSMTVKENVADLFHEGQYFTLTFEEDDEAPANVRSEGEATLSDTGEGSTDEEK